jgi:hypothetical protein
VKWTGEGMQGALELGKMADRFELRVPRGLDSIVSIPNER